MSNNVSRSRGPGDAEPSAPGDDADVALEGIVIADGGWSSEDAGAPRISAFIWGGKVRPTPVIPFGRWKGAA